MYLDAYIHTHMSVYVRNSKHNKRMWSILWNILTGIQHNIPPLDSLIETVLGFYGSFYIRIHHHWKKDNKYDATVAQSFGQANHRNSVATYIYRTDLSAVSFDEVFFFLLLVMFLFIRVLVSYTLCVVFFFNFKRVW